MPTVTIPTHDARGDEIRSDEHGWRFWHLAEVGNGVYAECRACRHVVRATGAALERRFGRHCTLEMIGPGLTCSACGGRDINYHLIGMGGSPHPGPMSEEQRGAHARARTLLTDPEN